MHRILASKHLPPELEPVLRVRGVDAGGRHMTGDPKDDHGEERNALPAAQTFGAECGQIEGQHRGRKQHVGHQLTGEPGQAGADGERSCHR